MDDREDIILGLYCAIGALRALNSKFPKTGQLVEPAIQACSGAVNLLKEQEPKEIELEGGGSSWWYVCPECHGAVDRTDRFCRHCGQAITDNETEVQK